MEMNLTIDRGNSTVKAAAWTHDNQIVATERGDADCRVEDLVRRLSERLLLPGDRFGAAAYCTVVPGHRDDDMSDLKSICPKVLDITIATPLPFEIAYTTPATLGADRIAAVAGALSLIPEPGPVLVADLGTAATYEFVDAEGVYLGGNIAPGIEMRLEALHAFTALLPQIDPAGPTPLWGNSTYTALRSGAMRGVAAELDYYLRMAPEGTAAILTGGSVPMLLDAGLITFKHTYEPLLVHRGLNSIIHYNEN